MDDTLFTIRYPFADGDGQDGVSIATVRPATILADVAVAVHPDDPRYRDAIGREVRRPVRRAARAGDRRRADRPRVRHRRAQGHAGPRSARLRHRARPRPARADGRRLGRPDERGGGRPRRAHPGGRGRARARLGRGARPRSSSASRTATRSGRASAVTRASSRSSRCSGGAPWRSLPPGDRGAPRAPRPLPPGVAAPLRDRLARGVAGLVHLAPALVGAPAPDLVLPGRAHDRGGRRAVSLRRVRRRPSSSASRTSSTRGSRPRSGRTRRSAGPTRRRSSRATTPETSTRPPARSSASGRTG